MATAAAANPKSAVAKSTEEINTQREAFVSQLRARFSLFYFRLIFFFSLKKNIIFTATQNEIDFVLQ